jgi:hypothetical protein
LACFLRRISNPISAAPPGKSGSADGSVVNVAPPDTLVVNGSALVGALPSVGIIEPSPIWRRIVANRGNTGDAKQPPKKK